MGSNNKFAIFYVFNILKRRPTRYCETKKFVAHLKFWWGPTHPALADDKECVADGALPDDVLALLVGRLLHHVGNLDEGLLGQVDKGGD